MLLLCPLTIGLDWWHIILKKRALLITKILYNNVKFQDNYGETISMSDSQTIESSLWQPKSRLTGLNWTKYLWAYEKIIKSFIYCLRVYVGAAWHGGSIGRSHPAAPGSNLVIQKMFSQIFEDSALMNRVVGLKMWAATKWNHSNDLRFQWPLRTLHSQRIKTTITRLVLNIS